MKKFVVLSLISFLILAFGTAYAQEKAPVLEFKASGWIDMSAEWKLNVPEGGSADTNNDALYGPAVAATYRPGGGAYDQHETWLRSRGRLKFDAIMGKDMMGTFQFEFDADKWGSGDGTRNRAGYWLADRAALEVKHMFITFGMPWVGIPITWQIGIQPIAVRPRVNLYNDGPGITVAAKIDPVLVKFMYFKQWEGKNWASDDMNIYGLEANAKISTVTVGGYGLAYNMNSYSTTWGADPPTAEALMWWYGLYMDGKLGPINLNFDLGADSGKVKDRRDLATKARDVDYFGWMARAEITYPWEKFTFGGVFAYGSGSDASETSLSGQPGSTSDAGTATSDVKGYVFAPGSEGGPGDLMVVNAHPDYDRGLTGFIQAPANQMSRNLYGGIWFAKLYAAMQFSPIWKVSVAAAYVGDTTKNGNTIGNARKSNGRLQDDSDIGWEFDILNQLLIYKNLTWDVGFGYLVAGDAVDYNVSGTTNDSPKNPYALVSRLTYSF